MAILKSDAIVLRVIDYSETSLIAWLFTRDHGRVHVLAKGARRPRSVFEGALEPLVRGELVWYRKARKSEGLETAKEFDPSERHTGLRKSLERLHRGLYVGELLRALTELELPAEDAFDAACETLAALATAEEALLDAHLIRGELKLLESAGFSPRLTLPDGSVPAQATRFAPAAGGLVDPEEHVPGAVSVSPGALKTLVALRRGTLVALSPGVRRELRQLLHAFFTYHLERPLRMQAFLQ
ncbi:MAG: DNA repair protein RecO [Planctomycetes bacterium]|nr:DNA repair protein RecO [Planctomycetota bacterium]